MERIEATLTKGLGWQDLYGHNGQLVTSTWGTVEVQLERRGTYMITILNNGSIVGWYHYVEVIKWRKGLGCVALAKVEV